jgi:hypothetical protein
MSAGSNIPLGELRPSQLLYTYGIGAVVDLPHISAMIMGLEDWNVDRCPTIAEERLLRDVRRFVGEQVQHLVAPSPRRPRPPPPAPGCPPRTSPSSASPSPPSPAGCAAGSASPVGRCRSSPWCSGTRFRDCTPKGATEVSEVVCGRAHIDGVRAKDARRRRIRSPGYVLRSMKRLRSYAFQ